MPPSRHLSSSIFSVKSALDLSQNQSSFSFPAISFPAGEQAPTSVSITICGASSIFKMSAITCIISNPRRLCNNPAYRTNDVQPSDVGLEPLPLGDNGIYSRKHYRNEQTAKGSSPTSSRSLPILPTQLILPAQDTHGASFHKDMVTPPWRIQEIDGTPYLWRLNLLADDFTIEVSADAEVEK